MSLKLFEPKEIERTIFQRDITLFHELFEVERTASKIAVPSELLLYVIHGILNRSLNLEKYLIAVIEQNINFYQEARVNDSISVDFHLSYPKKTTCDVDFIVFNQRNQQVADGRWKLKLRKVEVAEHVENNPIS